MSAPAKKPAKPARPSIVASGSAAYPAAVETLIDQFARLPGIGRRSAERLAFHVLRAAPEEAMALSRAVADVKRTVRHCAVCFNFAEGERCRVCDDPRRDAGVVLVVEQPRDVLAVESTGMYRGVYHVLMGRISPLDGVEPGDLTIDRLIRRVEDPATNTRTEPVREVILGLNPTLEGDGTALYLAQALAAKGVTITRLSRGLATGSSLEASNKAVLADAIEGRRALG